MSAYVQVPKEDIIALLEKSGFTELGTYQHRELVYERVHKENSAIRVRVYTSITRGDDVVRRKGKDSIKVCTIVQGRNKIFGIGKFPRIHRTGSTEKVLARMLERMRAAYARGTEWLREQQIKDVMLG